MIGRRAAMAAQALALVAVGLVLVVAALTAPAAEPAPLRWRPATEQERADYDARQLSAVLDELAAQREGVTPAATAVTPESRTRTTR
ncbi:hypothetical protein ACIBBG_32155 [Micromonospora chersina]|uniref:hypothetical protein n=1 Tax=Micromonospora chersina TaxID=47854 RepID=UPI0037BAB86C